LRSSSAFPKPSRIAYWHDVGHAQIKAAYGLLDTQSHLEALAPHLRGFHIHDVSAAGKDHQALGTGIVDFDHLATFFRPQHQLVLELSPKLTRDEVKGSQDFLCRLLQSMPQLSTG
jgi:sugar phosphate isomerase/epimerase